MNHRSRSAPPIEAGTSYPSEMAPSRKKTLFLRLEELLLAAGSVPRAR